MGIAEMLIERLDRGDYALRKLPSEMELAEETGVSRMTARRALKHLIDAGVFRRDPNRRLEVSADGRGRVHQIAFLMPPVISEDVQAWQWAAEQAVATIKGVLRPIVYTDWNDVLLSGALKGFDGVFLMQTGVDVPESAIAVLRNSPNPGVALDLDLSAQNIPSIWLFPEKAVWRLLDHLRKLGHRRIACFHTCDMNRVFRQRIDSWRKWKELHGLEGGLFNLPGRAASIDYGAIQAEKECDRLLAAGTLGDTAILCTNVWTALGVNRAIRKHGLTVGRDISTCAINDEMLAPWMNPSLTALRMPDPSAMLRTCVQWMAAGGRDWQGPKLLVPRQVPLFEGESTGPPPAVAL
ncbi:MAG TPA: substrate-binding domain-containing protein [Luteolibacter sp.]|nr:substrate-binding domain-containing protein [Luteolibacter sp.]